MTISDHTCDHPMSSGLCGLRPGHNLPHRSAASLEQRRANGRGSANAARKREYRQRTGSGRLSAEVKQERLLARWATSEHDRAWYRFFERQTRRERLLRLCIHCESVVEMEGVRQKVCANCKSSRWKPSREAVLNGARRYRERKRNATYRDLTDIDSVCYICGGEFNIWCY